MGTNDNTKKDPKSLENKSRRKAVKTIAGGVTALAAYHVLPSTWSKPLIEQVFLPAHAATSGSGLFDPCEITLIEGYQDSKSVKFTVKGYVSPPTANIPVQIQAYGTPDSSKESVKTTTNKKGQFEATITLTTTTGIGVVHVTTTAKGAAGSAKCSIDVPRRHNKVNKVTYFSDSLLWDVDRARIGWLAATVSNGTATLVRINLNNSRKWVANFSSVPGSGDWNNTDSAAGCGPPSFNPISVNVTSVTAAEFAFTVNWPTGETFNFILPAAKIPPEPALIGNCGGGN